MNLTFETELLRKLAQDERVRTNLDKKVIRAYQSRVAQIISAEDERALRADKGAHFELMHAGLYSMRLNRNWRVEFEIIPGQPKNTIHIVEIRNHYE